MAIRAILHGDDELEVKMLTGDAGFMSRYMQRGALGGGVQNTKHLEF